MDVLLSNNCPPLWRKAHLEVKMFKNCKSSEHFWTFCCRIIVRRCGEKHICQSKCSKTVVFGALLDVLLSNHCTPPKCSKTVVFGALLDVLLSNHCTPLWRKALLPVKMFKNCSLWSTFGRSAVESLSAAVAKSTFGSENAKKLRVREHFLTF